jgi:hypothetical protein
MIQLHERVTMVLWALTAVAIAAFVAVMFWWVP